VGSVSPQNGYIYNAESISATRIVVTLTSSTQKLKFNAELIGGRVVTSLIASQISVTTPAGTTAPAATTAIASAPASTTAPRTSSHHEDDKHEEHDDD
jgi:hypothetical protein